MTLINDLRRAFTMPLPGETAHQKMSPNYRHHFGAELPDKSMLRNSSVMILLYRKGGEWHLPLIKRPSYNGAHSGQICLPGGKWEPCDINPWFSALRETDEETGIHSGIEKIGELTPLYIPNSNFMVFPQVGLLGDEPKFMPDPYEVESLVDASLSDFVSDENIMSFTFQSGDKLVQAPYYNIKGHCVWGATAMIISEFLEVLNNSSLLVSLSGSYTVHSEPESL